MLAHHAVGDGEQDPAISDVDGDRTRCRVRRQWPHQIRDDERVLLVEASRERMVERVRVLSRRTVAAEEDQSRRVHRQSEAERIFGRRVGR